MLNAPVKAWRSPSTELAAQHEEFAEWFRREQGTFPITDFEVFRRAIAWIDSGNDLLDETVTTERGALYHLYGGRYDADDALSRIDCYIQFTGSKNWQSSK